MTSSVHAEGAELQNRQRFEFLRLAPALKRVGPHIVGAQGERFRTAEMTMDLVDLTAARKSRTRIRSRRMRVSGSGRTRNNSRIRITTNDTRTTTNDTRI